MAEETAEKQQPGSADLRACGAIPGSAAPPPAQEFVNQSGARLGSAHRPGLEPARAKVITGGRATDPPRASRDGREIASHRQEAIMSPSRGSRSPVCRLWRPRFLFSLHITGFAKINQAGALLVPTTADRRNAAAARSAMRPGSATATSWPSARCRFSPRTAGCRARATPGARWRASVPSARACSPPPRCAALANLVAVATPAPSSWPPP